MTTQTMLNLNPYFWFSKTLFDKLLKVNFLVKWSYTNNSLRDFLYLNNLGTNLNFALHNHYCNISLPFYLENFGFQPQMVQYSS